ncbi:hypothetical protein [Spirosoma sordidisoli]|uniref:Uncharacterized protein n=1 Tax=Spirosoma sordidisoli TaxID=2502893 RepID=A0A4Q2UKN2_9BACT|nr:hypothetical protein [Spirosoma sordidisoli]RYC69776.1 hypothetical protein EQG79_14370 [Spirosoma sordidisoli]
MQLDFDNMASLLEPGKQEQVLAHFGLGQDFRDRLDLVSEAFRIHVINMVIQAHRSCSGDVEQFHESLLLKTLFGMVDQYVKPQSVAEVACVSFLASALLAGCETILSPVLGMIQTTTFHGGTATA